MGFYGRVDNVMSSASFVLDKTYFNRANMDKNCSEDGVFIGRYVLVDYHEGEPNNQTAYDKNANIDKEVYKTDEYDSTVWQKVYAEGSGEKYVMVAELNSVTPEFSMVVDAPTFHPMKPHYGEDSTSINYKLHFQPSWGFKIGETTEDKSDENVTYEGLDWNPKTQKFENVKKVYPGSIYFNKDAMGAEEVKKNTYSQGEDRISIAYTASGNTYNPYHPESTGTEKPQVALPDTQELSIYLPSIGNSISHMWDLVYGPADQQTDKIDIFRRNTLVDWDTVSGLRLIKKKADGTGFEYDTESVKTLAGSINSVHDLMGMIITEHKPKQKDETEEKYKARIDVNNSLINRIYFGHLDESDPNYKGYFIKDLTYTNPEEGVLEDEETLMDLKDFKDKDYYYLNNDNYYYEDSGYHFGNKYYDLSEAVEAINLASQEYRPKLYYYKDKSGNYILETAELPDENKSYYELTNRNTKTEVNNSKLIRFFPTDEDYYVNCFKNMEKEPAKDVDGQMKGTGWFYKGETDPDYQAFQFGITPFMDLYYIENYVVQISSLPGGGYEETLEFNYPGTIITKYTMVQFENNTYYEKVGNDSILLPSEKDIDINKVYVSYLDGTYRPISNKFYEPNLYYYMDGKDYILAKEENRLDGIQYYTINIAILEAINDVFYEPNKYYYKDEITGEWILDHRKEMDKSKEYYKINFIRVINGGGIYESGAKWNHNVKEIPEGVTVGLYKEAYQWKELTGFSRTLNTIHGLILEINNLLKFNDHLTRDTTTVQGCINSLKDILNQFDKLTPGNVLMVNKYGKATSELLTNMELTGYVKVEGEEVILPEDTLGEGLGKLQTQILEEQKARKDDGVAVLAELAQEIADREAADSTEKAAREAADATEQAAREKADSDEIAAREAAITQEVADRNAAIEAAITQEVADRNAAIAIETAAREKAVSDEKSEREKALAQEIADREAADGILSDAIAAEIKNREDAIITLDFKISESVGIGAVVTSISQTAGKVNATEKKIGELTLSGYELKNNATHITYEDSINNAFSKAQSQIDNLYTRNDGINKEVKDNYLRKEEFNTYVKQVEEKDKAQDNLIEELGEDIELLFTRNDGINREVKENYVRKEEFNPIITSIDTLEELVENLGGTVDSHSDLIEGINENIELLFVRNDGINKEVKDNYVRKEEMNVIVQGLLETIAKLEERIVELEGQINN